MAGVASFISYLALINAYHKQLKMVFLQNEAIWYQLLVIDISLYFH